MDDRRKVIIVVDLSVILMCHYESIKLLNFQLVSRIVTGHQQPGAKIGFWVWSMLHDEIWSFIDCK